MAWNPFAKQSSASHELRPAGDSPAATRFAFNVFQQILKEQPGENVFFSPVSIHFVLSMAYAGASGETRSEMARALELHGLSAADVSAGNKILKTLLERRDVELSIANSLWSAKDVSFKSEYARLAREDYCAGARALDFNTPDSAEVINGWCSERTRGRINSIISHKELKSCLLVLINALYFKGAWAKGFEFEPEATQDRAFSLSHGDSKTVPIMTGFNTYPYLQGENFQAVKIAYGVGDIQMIVMLPDRTTTAVEFLQQLTAEKWEACMRSFNESDGTLSFPRFKFEFEASLNDALKTLGMPSAFTPQADFSEMSTAPMMIGMVKHKTFVDVNERGTEAVAATAVMGDLGCAAPGPQKLFEMMVDRPFICAIRDDRTGSLLFLGAIYDPKPE